MATFSTDRRIPAPQVDPTNKAYFDAAREGRFLIGRCKDTGRHFFYPRGVSPFTLSANVELVEAKGTGTVYSFSVMRTKQPYCIAYVELDEGPRMITNIVDCDLDAVRIGDRVQLVFKPAENDGYQLAMFTPIRDRTAT
jgi:uncharacterized OB-fold protein